MDKMTIQEFWENHNIDCWRIKRFTMVDFYFYAETARYIYKTAFGEWRGTKNPYPRILFPAGEEPKNTSFNDEDSAVRWIKGEGDD